MIGFHGSSTGAATTASVTAGQRNRDFANHSGGCLLSSCMDSQRDARPGIKLEGVTKSFGDLRAVDHVSLSAQPGRVLGLLGHNGAGKTTLMRLIAGLLRPDAGSVSVHDLDPSIDGEAVRQGLGVLPSSPIVDGRLTALENLDFAASVRGLDPHEARAHAAQLLAQFDLQDRADDRAAEYSAGMKQRLSLACVLIGRPGTLLLDEPTSAMDPLAACDFLDRLRHLCTIEDRTIIIATHDLAVASELCDKLMILSQGQVIAHGAPRALTEQLGTKTQIRVGPHDQVNRAVEIVRAFDPTASIVDDRTVEADRLTGSLAPAVARRIIETGLDLYSFREETATLENLYFQLHDESLDQTPMPDLDRSETGRCITQGVSQ